MPQAERVKVGRCRLWSGGFGARERGPYAPCALERGHDGKCMPDIWADPKWGKWPRNVFQFGYLINPQSTSMMGLYSRARWQTTDRLADRRAIRANRRLAKKVLASPEAWRRWSRGMAPRYWRMTGLRNERGQQREWA